jgi:hypothetical protein
MPSIALIVEDDLDQFDAYQPLKAIGRSLNKLNEVADEIGCSRLTEFYTGEDDSDRFGREVMDEIAEHEGWSDYRAGGGGDKDAWFDAEEGLEVVRALQGYIDSGRETFKKPEAILKELALMENVLVEAVNQSLRFRIEADE